MKKNSSTQLNASAIKEVQSTIRSVADLVCNPRSKTLFEASNNAILYSFEKLPFSFETINIRLTLIDANYSTNMRFNLFGLEELAKRIFDIGSDSKLVAEFQNYLKTGNSKVISDMFNEPYGINKNLSDGRSAVSLISKYGFFLFKSDKLLNDTVGFPIYDSIVRDMYPVVCKFIGLIPKPTKDMVNFDSYFPALVELCEVLQLEKLYDKTMKVQLFDMLDLYLWRLGKVSNGSLSLLLSREEYTKYIVSIGLKEYVKKDNKVTFDTMLLQKMQTRTKGEPAIIPLMMEHWKKLNSK